MPGSKKYGKAVKQRSITFRAEQFDFLAGLPNASEWVRDAVDEKLASQTEGMDALSLVSRIAALHRKRAKIIDDQPYRLSSYTQDFDDVMAAIESDDFMRLSQENGDITAPLSVKGGFKHYYLPLSSDVFLAFTDKHDLREKAGSYALEGEQLEAFKELVRNNWTYYARVSDMLRAEIAEIESDIERLQDHLISGKGL